MYPWIDPLEEKMTSISLLPAQTLIVSIQFSARWGSRNSMLRVRIVYLESGTTTVMTGELLD